VASSDSEPSKPRVIGAPFGGSASGAASGPHSTGVSHCSTSATGRFRKYLAAVAFDVFGSRISDKIRSRSSQAAAAPYAARRQANTSESSSQSAGMGPSRWSKRRPRF